MHRPMVATLVGLVALPLAATAEIEQVPAEGNVDAVMNRLESSVATAGATIFAKVDHGAGAESIGTPVGASRLLIFGNPRLGTPAIADDPLAGLVLPLQVLVYEDSEGQTWIAYRNVEEMFDELDVDADAEYLQNIETVLDGFIESARE